MNFIPVPSDLTDEELLLMLGRDYEEEPKKKQPEKQGLQLERIDSRVKHASEALPAKMMPCIDELDELEEEIFGTKSQIVPTMDIERKGPTKRESEDMEMKSFGNFERHLVTQPDKELKLPVEEMIARATHKVWKSNPHIRPFRIQEWQELAREKGFHKAENIFLFVVQYEVLNDIIVLDLSDSKDQVRSSMPRSSFLTEDPIFDREVNFESFYRIFQPKEDLYFMNGTKLWTGVVLWLTDVTMIHLSDSAEGSFCLVFTSKNVQGVFEPGILN
jgi:hypothetical protein